jgi:hypothetical protein
MRVMVVECHLKVEKTVRMRQVSDTNRSIKPAVVTTSTQSMRLTYTTIGSCPAVVVLGRTGPIVNDRDEAGVWTFV